MVKKWFVFLVLIIFSIGSFYSGAWWIGIFLGWIAILAIPHEKIQRKGQAFLNGLGQVLLSLFYLAIFLFFIYAAFWVVGKIFTGVMGMGKYDGKTAKEWATSYAELNTKYDDLKTKYEPQDNPFDIEDFNSLKKKVDCVKNLTFYYTSEPYYFEYYKKEDVSSCTLLGY